MKRTCLYLLLIITATASTVWADSPHGNDLVESKSLSAVLHEADALRLYENPYWRKLLHYRKRLFGGYRSEIEAAGFFRAKDGRSNPKAELEATVRSFFDEIENQSFVLHPQCLFLDRFQFIRSQLRPETAALFPKASCIPYENWRATVSPKSVTYVFSSYYMGSAASFFGHTLLRLNHDPNSPEATPLLDYGVNYAADPTTFNPMLYAMLGMTGGFQGTFSSIPYYLKVEEYADFERRDIWEYDLNLSQAELDRLLVHLWTLGQFRIRYFYFDMNCSYMLLTLLDAAKPELSLAERFHGWVIPSDTLHALNDVPGLVSRVGYRPSSLSRLRFLADRLNADERKLFFDLVELKRSPDQMLKQPPSVATLDASLEYFRFKKAAQSHRLTPDQSLQNQMLLIARSQMPEPAPDFSGLEANRKPDAPEAGHRSARIQLAGGINPRNSDTFTELGYRAAFHDLNAYPIGFAPLSQVELFQLKLRYYDDRKKFRLNQLDLVSVYSLSPISSLLARPSWAAELGLRPARQSSCVDCLEWVGSYGPGATTTLFGDQRGVSVFMLARLEAAIASSLAPWARLDVVPDMGVLVHPHERISLLSRAQYVTRLAGRDESFLRMSHELRANFDAHKELRFSFDRVRTHSEAKLTFGLYF